MSTYVPPANGFRTFLTVWVSQSLSIFGSALTFFAISIWLTQTLYPDPEQRAQLAFALSALALSRGIPFILITPFSGAWADRHDRKQTMLFMDVANLILTLGLLTLMASHSLQIWMLILIGALSASFDSFHNAAFDSSYVMLVSKDQLPRANGMMQTMWALSTVLSPAMAATVIALPAMARSGNWGGLGAWMARMSDGAPLAIGINAATFMVAAIVLLFLNIPSPKRRDVTESGKLKKSVMADVREGAIFVWRRKPLLWLLASFTVANFCTSPTGVLLPLMVKFNMAADWGSKGLGFEAALATLTTATAVGGLVGGLVVSAWGGLRQRRVLGVLIPMIISGCSLILFGLVPLLYVSAAMLFVGGFCMPMMNAHSQSIWQTQTPPELQGRVFSVRRVIAQFTGPLSVGVMGLSAGIFDPGVVLATLGLLFVLFTVAQLFNPLLLRVEDKEYLDSLGAEAAVSAQ